MTRWMALCGVLAAIGGCREQAAPVAPAAVAVSAPPVESAVESAVEAAAKMDSRTPVPLLPMMAQHQKQQMRDHLVAIQEMVTALANNDFAGVEQATGKIGYSDSMAQMCDHMGAGAPGFTPVAIAFHHTADTIGAAAKKRDRAAVLAALQATLGACVGCHATYKQQVVDQATWTRLTAMAPPTGPPHGP